VRGARVGSRDQEQVLAAPRGGRGPDLGDHLLGRDHVLAGHVAAALGRDLVLDEDRRRAQRLVALDGVGDILHVAIAGVAIDQHWQVCRRHDVANAGADFAERGQADVGNAVARPDQREAADGVGRKAGTFDQPRRQRVVRARQQQRLLLPEQVLPGRSLGHSGIPSRAYQAFSGSVYAARSRMIL
jgi:hypothetical protein